MLGVSEQAAQREHGDNPPRRPIGSADGARRDDPLGWLPSDGGDPVVVGVVVHDRDAMALGNGGHEKIGKRHSPDEVAVAPAAVELDRSFPVGVLGGQPFVAHLSVREHPVELADGTSRPQHLEFDDAQVATSPASMSGPRTAYTLALLNRANALVSAMYSATAAMPRS